MEKRVDVLSSEQVLDQQRLLRRQVVQSSFNSFLIAALLSFPFLIQMIAKGLGYSFEVGSAWQWILATLVQFGCGWPLYLSAYRALKAKRGNMDLLIVLGTTAAYSLSLAVYFWHLPQYLYFESSAIIITLTLLGRWLEALMQGRMSKTLEQLLHSQPKSARLDKGKQAIADITVAKPGDLFVVHPGERIPVDGIVREGEASVNELLLTGISTPVFKEAGSAVFAGTTSERGLIHIQATQVGAETRLSQLIRLVEQAQMPNTPVSKRGDGIAAIFIPLILLISVLTWGVWTFWWESPESGALNAIAVLAIACPCAIGLVNPLILLMTKEAGEKQGILFKDATSLEQVGQLRVLFFEKTGTLTEGCPTISAIYPHAKHPKEEVLQLAASLESFSFHSLAKAISNRAKHEGIALKRVEDFQSMDKGVSGSIDGKVYYLGSISFAEEMGIEVEPALTLLEHKGETLVLVWTAKHLVGLISLIDQVRPKSAEAIRLLKERGIHPILLTGDRKGTAESVAHLVGIEDVRNGLLPAEKVGIVREAKQAGIVGIVGDAIDNAKALAEADVSFAFGYRAVALEAASINLKRNDLMGVVDAVDLSFKSMSKMRQNLFLAFVYNILAIPLAASGLLNPMIVAGTMATSLVSVVANALLLRYWKPLSE
ncbi:putative copper-transporting ATPase [Candidatus Protochlamydia naegleriophila]|uniref:Putative copper-transporting ATPase n=1 Tax=Candidatus Protochlamydia naegleriophila TaxID=389348 RepID=A0A0U5J7I7_9BACT|nr:heavy metal translocating P-type ATPase [Candidatus Protochlamydia naegleriophila]CUI15704.1 putative copper-transporting ATPase [Candidatus Protochlamydia naegleriophila]